MSAPRVGVVLAPPSEGSGAVASATLLFGRGALAVDGCNLRHDGGALRLVLPAGVRFCCNSLRDAAEAALVAAYGHDLAEGAALVFGSGKGGA